MKKLGIVCFLFFMFALPIEANTKKQVQFAKCTDGDTAHFIVDGKDETVRFLAIDTPEYTKEKEPYGKEASEFTCSRIKNANVIELEFDEGSDERDKYGRMLAWVYADGTLLQRELVKEGLAEVKYIYGDYAYTDELQSLETSAKQQKLNMWSDEPELKLELWQIIALAVGGIAIIGISLSSMKDKKRKINKIKKGMKKIVK